jgi:hypothetical protein
MMVHPVRLGALALGIAKSLAPTFTHATTYQAQLLEPLQLAQPLVDGRFEATANNAAGLTVGSVRFNTPKQINLPPCQVRVLTPRDSPASPTKRPLCLPMVN